MPVIAVPRVLREKLGEDGVDSLVELFNKSEERIKEDVITLSAEKFARRLSEEISGVRSDIAIMEGKLEARISGVRAEMKEEVTSLRAEMKEEVTSLRAEMKEETSKIRVEMAQFKSEIIKWMFLFWIGQIACMAGIVKWLR
ncbi:MAG: hypothetical protein AB1422_13355 [bacterium]